MQASKSAEKPENIWINLIFNILIPTLILTKFSGEQQLGPQWGVVIALAFPVGYGVRDYWQRKKLNFFSALGVISVLLTGGMSLLEIDPKYIAIKEAAIPALFGLATLISLKTPWPLVRTFLYNDQVLETDRVNRALDQYETHAAFERALRNASIMLAGSFFLSSVLNYLLARWVLVSPPGTEAFNAELGKMTALSFPVITLPAMVVLMSAFFYLFREIKRLTHLDLEDIVRHQEKN